MVRRAQVALLAQRVGGRLGLAAEQVQGVAAARRVERAGVADGAVVLPGRVYLVDRPDAAQTVVAQ